MRAIEAQALNKGLITYLVQDAGRTQIAAGSRTVSHSRLDWPDRLPILNPIASLHRGDMYCVTFCSVCPTRGSNASDSS